MKALLRFSVSLSVTLMLSSCSLLQQEPTHKNTEHKNTEHHSIDQQRAISHSEPAKTDTVSSNSMQRYYLAENGERRKPQEILNEFGKSWLYGPGIGQTTLNVSSIILFPPTALLLVTNGILTYFGAEPLGVSTLLSGESEEEWNAAYDGVISVPGRISALLAGRDYYLPQQGADGEDDGQLLHEYLEKR